MRDIYLLVLMSLYCCSITAAYASEQKEQAPDPFALVVQSSEGHQTDKLGTDEHFEDLTNSLLNPISFDSSSSSFSGQLLDSPPLNPSSHFTPVMPMSLASSNTSQNSSYPRTLVQGCSPSGPYSVLPIAQWQMESARAAVLQQSTSPKKLPRKVSSSSYSSTQSGSSTHSLANVLASSSSSFGSSSSSASSVGSNFTSSTSSLSSTTSPKKRSASPRKRKAPASNSSSLPQQPLPAGKGSPVKRPLYGTPYGCGHCKTAINSKKNLLAHIELYHPESGRNKVSVCRICNFISFTDSDLKWIEKHMEEQHKGR